MARIHLLFFMVLCILIASLQADMHCSCRCCNNPLCTKPIHVPIIAIFKHCDDASCKTRCQIRHPDKCDHKRGKVVPTCTRLISTTRMTTTRTTRTTEKSTTDRRFQWYGAPLCERGNCYPAKWCSNNQENYLKMIWFLWFEVITNKQ